MPTHPAGPTLLVVMGDPFARERLMEEFSRRGAACRFRSANDAPAALALLRGGQLPDLVLADAALLAPLVSGLRAEARLRDLPLFVMGPAAVDGDAPRVIPLARPFRLGEFLAAARVHGLAGLFT